MAKSNHYVNNADLLKAIIQYKKDCKDAKAIGGSKPKIPEYVGSCLQLIAENLSHKPNFNQYTFKEEMIGDGIENCILYFDNFDPKRFKNPFAYFTQIIYYAFLRRIAREKKQLYIKYKATQEYGILGNQHSENDGNDTNSQFETYDNISDFIGNFEESKRKKKKEKKTRLELFMVEDVTNFTPDEL